MKDAPSQHPLLVLSYLKFPFARLFPGKQSFIVLKEP
jgi:hypothetical protein